MAPPVEISIPSTTLSTTTASSSSKPYTLYNITLRLPLRTFVVQKRYSEFTALDTTLRSQTTAPPPQPLPAKSWFRSTSNSPELTEERRKGLEAYLRAIAESPERTWRETSAWRSFLNLPSSTAASYASKPGAGTGEGASDPAVWVDVLREMKELLRDARSFLGRRDGAATAQAQHEAGANAKRCLVKAGTLLGSLEEGLKGMVEKGKGREGDGWGGMSAGLGEGELRRRRDLLASARVEKEGLEKLSVSLAVKGQGGGASNGAGAATATQQDKSTLFGPGVARPSGRVLGAPVPETDKTRELDNEGVVQLQKQIMRDQDLDVEELAKIVRRQKDMGMAINEELEVQNEMLGILDQDVDRVQTKVGIAKRRIGKIK